MDERELRKLFERANANLLTHDKSLLDRQVSERTLCGALMLWLHEELAEESLSGKFQGYYVDVEYNRNGGSVKTCKRNDEKIITINCDLIIHSRGEKGLNNSDDNLIAIEMKKSTRTQTEKQGDRERLMALTKDYEEGGIYANGDGADPEYVCGYALGVFYEIDYAKEMVKVEYYKKGKMFKTTFFPFSAFCKETEQIHAAQ